MNFKFEKLSADTNERILLNKLKEYNENPIINGYIVQLPLPFQINQTKILNNIHPKKDVDGFHPNNQ
jgi:methylenetetrahydrofolate dehydrogenase (NADP+)/methenyltetrahydrofolate cyclohydrolase